MGYALSIDVGTTFTAAATWQAGRASTVTLGDHSDAIPSVLYLRPDDGTFLFGAAAERRAIADPSRIAREFKRRMGDDVKMMLDNQEFSTQELTASVIRWVVDFTAAREGAQPSHVTLTCPASWGDYRRRLMNEAASIAGLDAVGLMSEPGAAATYYASLNRLEPQSTVAVYDFGGGTFDAAVLVKTADGFELCGSPQGDNEIGGVNFDAAILRLIAEEVGLKFSPFGFEDPEMAAAQAQLQARAIDAKEALSTDRVVDIPVILPGISRTVRLTRDQFENAIRDDVLGTIDTLRDTIEHAQIDPSMLSAVLLVGGSSRIPLVAELVQAELGVRTMVDAHPKHAVCLGAAIAASSRVGHAPARIPAGSTPPAGRFAMPVSNGSRNDVIGPQRPQPEGVPLTGVAHAGDDGGEADAPGVQLTAAPGRVSADGGAVDVDLIAAGLTAPLDSQLIPVPTPWAHLHKVSRDEPLIIRLNELPDRDAVNRRLRMRFVLLVVGAVIVLGAVLLIAGLR